MNLICQYYSLLQSQQDLMCQLLLECVEKEDLRDHLLDKCLERGQYYILQLIQLEVVLVIKV